MWVVFEDIKSPIKMELFIRLFQQQTRSDAVVAN
jgi:hypothetical protein